MDACRRGQAWRQTLLLLADIAARKVSPDVVSFSTCAAACERGSAWELALLALLRQCQQEAGIALDQKGFTAALGACARGGRWVLALELLEDMERWALSPDLICCNSAIRACGSGLAWEQSLHLLESLQNRSLSDPVSYNTAVGACDAAGRWTQSLEILQDMRRRGVRRTVVSYNAAVKACFHASGGGWRGGLAIHAEMVAEQVSPDVVTYSSIFSALAPSALWREALQLLNQMSSSGTASDGHCWNAAATVLAQAPMCRRELLAAYRGAEDAGTLTPWSPEEPDVVDLHGHGVDMALAAVDSVLHDMVVQPTGRHCHDPRLDLVVITGKGSHSEEGASRIFPALAEFLDTEFEPPLKLRRLGRAPHGRSVIPREALQHWAQAQLEAPLGGQRGGAEQS